jgi:peptidyl-prolyl cis-trans isomerase C
MQYKLRNGVLAITISLLVICWAAGTQAQDSTSTGKNTTTNKNSTTKSAATDKNASTSKNTATNKNSATKKNATASNGKIASVNGVAIAQAQYDRAMAPVLQQVASLAKGAVTDEQMAQVKSRIIENLIATELLYQESQKSGVTVNDKEINATYDEQKAQYKTDAEFQKAMTDAKYNEATFKTQIKLGLTIQRYIDQKFAQNTTISDDDIKKFYDENTSQFQQPAQIKASHIMIMVDATADQEKKDAAKKKLETVLQRLKAGEDFAAVAKEVSEDPYTKDKGGELGYFSKGEMVQSFEDAAFALKPGEISNIVETDYGYHIIKMTDKKDAKTVSLDESKESIKTNLKSTKVNSDVNKYVTELRDKAKVEIFLK